jgi:hypothetical protein
MVYRQVDQFIRGAQCMSEQLGSVTGQAILSHRHLLIDSCPHLCPSSSLLTLLLFVFLLVLLLPISQ